jgi:2-keto-4-pentenoate hydratase
MIATATTSVTGLSGIDRDRMYQASEILLDARRTVDPVPELPVNLRPTSLTEAYFLQDIMIAELGAVAGWKVGAPSPDVTPNFAPMYDFGIASSGSLIASAMRRLRGVEAEIAFLIGRDLPPRATPYTRDEVVAAIASAHPAIELIESAFFNPDAVDRLSMIGDLQMHGGFVHGPAFAGWRDFDYAQENVTVAVDGVVRTDKGANTAGPDLLRLVEWLANEGQDRTGGLRAGQWITTGSWMGKTLASPGSEVRVRFDHFGDVTLAFEVHEPKHPRTEPVVLHN